jgi:hypothetical protein
VIHGESTASNALAEKIHEQYHFEVHVPIWKERLVLKSREVTVEPPPDTETLPEFRTHMLNAVIDVEKEIEALKKRVQSGEVQETDVDRLKYIQEEIQGMISEG